MQKRIPVQAVAVAVEAQVEAAVQRRNRLDKVHLRVTVHVHE